MQTARGLQTMKRMRSMKTTPDAPSAHGVPIFLRGGVFSKLDLAFKRVHIAPWLARKCALPVVPAHGGWVDMVRARWRLLPVVVTSPDRGEDL